MVYCICFQPLIERSEASDVDSFLDCAIDFDSDGSLIVDLEDLIWTIMWRFKFWNDPRFFQKHHVAHFVVVLDSAVIFVLCIFVS